MVRFSETALAGAHVVITRPVGSGASMARRVSAMGGRPHLLPGLALRAVEDVDFARTALREALAGDAVIFTSPAAVRFAARLSRLRPTATVMAVGGGTARALERAGVTGVQVPSGHASSEGLLEHPRLREVAGRRVAIVGARGGRDLLARTLRDRGARVREVYVYSRAPARLNRRHDEAVRALPAARYVLLSSRETLDNLKRGLAAATWTHLCGAVAVVSSERLREAARAAGFRRVRLARSALADDLLSAVVELHGTR